MQSTEHNRYQNYINVYNIGVCSIFSNPFGKLVQVIMKEVLEFEVIEIDNIFKCIHGSCKNKDKIFDALKHFHIESNLTI